jgi:hypothetical protein
VLVVVFLLALPGLLLGGLIVTGVATFGDPLAADIVASPSTAVVAP